MKCLVSGATGFIGRQLCQQLEARGDTVLAMSKNGAPLDNGAPTVALDLCVQNPGVDLLKGVEVVFHLAGIAHQRAAESAYPVLNCDATVRLARMASNAGVQCFIFLSSVKAMGPPDGLTARTENKCAMPSDAYGLSKWQAECALRDEFSDDPMSVIILRPALVYGANVKGNLQQLARGTRLGLPRPPDGGRRSMIAVEDLTDLLCVIAQAPPAGVHTWIACGADSYSTQNIYDLLRDASGKSKGKGWLPRWVWRMAARLLDFVRQQPGESTYEKLFGTEQYSNAALLTGTGWRPKVTLQDVIGQIASVQRSGR